MLNQRLPASGPRAPSSARCPRAPRLPGRCSGHESCGESVGLHPSSQSAFRPVRIHVVRAADVEAPPLLDERWLLLERGTRREDCPKAQQGNQRNNKPTPSNLLQHMVLAKLRLEPTTEASLRQASISYNPPTRGLARQCNRRKMRGASPHRTRAPLIASLACLVSGTGLQ